MNALLQAIEKWIGPKWASVIAAFAAMYGVSLPDLNELLRNFMEYTSGNPDLLAKGGLAALLAYVFRRARPEEGAVSPVERDDGVLFDDYDTPSAPRLDPPAVKVLKPVKNWFTDAEMDCKCQDLPGCDYQGMRPTLMAIINDLRETFGPLIVTSGYRCPEHNKAVGGVDGSYHVKGMACDLKSPTVSPSELYAYLNGKYPKRYGLGLYSRFIHVDCRSPMWARKTGPDQAWRQQDPDIILPT